MATISPKGVSSALQLDSTLIFLSNLVYPIHTPYSCCLPTIQDKEGLSVIVKFLIKISKVYIIFYEKLCKYTQFFIVVHSTLGIPSTKNLERDLAIKVLKSHYILGISTNSPGDLLISKSGIFGLLFLILYI